MNPDLTMALNEQIKNEFEAAYSYLSMSAYLDQQTLPGMAYWMRLQYQEETAHALKIVDHLLDRGQAVTFGTIAQPNGGYGSPLDVFERALKQEQTVTGCIHKLYALAVNHSDFASQAMLQWFVEEQVEEEKITGDVVAQLQRIGEDGPALLLLDQQLGQRQPEA